jgi:hypothetical protein
MQYRHKKIDYTTPSGHEGGPGVAKQWTPYVGTPYIDMTLAQYNAMGQTIGLKLGDTWTLGGNSPALGGNTFMLVKAQEALALGQLVAAEAPTTGTVTNNAGQSTTASILTNINNAATVPVNGDADNWLWITATGATLPQLRRIKTNTSSATARYVVALPDYSRPNSATDADVFDTLATNGDVCSVIRPYHVIVCTEAMTPLGVALGTVTQYNYTIIQIGGLANVLADADGVNEGLVEDQPAWTAPAGAIRGANGVANLYTQAALILPKLASVADVAAGLHVPCFVNFHAQ